MPDVPQTLLREQYRWHPKIIGFCNEKFCDNELMIMTQERSEPDTPAPLETPQGNHRRNHINQRQISEVYPVFDLLYQQYTDARIAYLKKHLRVSEYDSENLMYGTFCGLLQKRSGLSLRVICHQPLNMLMRDPHRLNDAERRYAMNTATHLDFLIYNRISKVPFLAIEVDGFHFHKIGTAQYECDRMKDYILTLYNIPLLRFQQTEAVKLKKLQKL